MTKKGVTVSILVVVVIVMLILATTIINSVSNSIKNSRLSVWTQEITNIQDIMRETKGDINKVLLDEVEFNVYNILDSIKLEQFADENIENNTIELYKIDLAKLGINNLVYGISSTEEDVYAYSKQTGRVYYLAGISGNSGKIYYTLTNELLNKYTSQSVSNNNLTTIVFNASSIKYTNQPVTVTVSVPKKYTNVSVTTSNPTVTVSNVIEEENKNVYQVNEDLYGINYTITVQYNDGEEKSIQYEVDIFDETTPEIENISSDYDIIDIIATDDKSGIKEMRYVITDVPSENIKEFFKTNGILIKNNRFKVNELVGVITIYVEDNAGNYMYYSM